MIDPTGTKPEDLANRVIRAGMGALPVIGSPILEFLAFAIGDPAQERRDDFMRETCQRLLDLEEQVDRLDQEALRDNEQFQATFIQATRLSTQNASNEKRRFLQNAIINSARLNIEENVRQILMQVLERVTSIHVVVLDVLDNPSARPEVRALQDRLMSGSLSHVIDAAIPALRGNRALADRVVADLEAMGMVAGASLHVTMTGQGLLAQRSTPLGRSFLQFVAEP